MAGSRKTMSTSAAAVRPEAQPHVLLVEDDLEISRMLQGVLSESGFAVSAVTDAGEMDAVLRLARVDLVVLDIMLPGEDGLSICRRLRAGSAIPIIMVTARGDAVDRIVGLEIGADDYLPKPFDSASWWRASGPCCGVPRAATAPAERSPCASPAGGSTRPRASCTIPKGCRWR